MYKLGVVAFFIALHIDVSSFESTDKSWSTEARLGLGLAGFAAIGVLACAGYQYFGVKPAQSSDPGQKGSGRGSLGGGGGAVGGDRTTTKGNRERVSEARNPGLIGPSSRTGPADDHRKSVPRPTRKGKDEIADICKQIGDTYGEWKSKDIHARQSQSGRRWCNFAGKCGSHISKLITALNKDKTKYDAWLGQINNCFRKVYKDQRPGSYMEYMNQRPGSSYMEYMDQKLGYYNTQLEQCYQLVKDLGVAGSSPSDSDVAAVVTGLSLWHAQSLSEFANTISDEQTVRQTGLDKDNSAQLVLRYIWMFTLFGGVCGAIPKASKWGDRFDWQFENESMYWKAFDNYFVKIDCLEPIEDLKPIDADSRRSPLEEQRASSKRSPQRTSSKRSPLEQHVCELLDIVVRDHCKALCNSSLDPAKGEPLQQVEKS